MVDILGSKKLLLWYLVIVAVGISFFLYDYFEVTPKENFSISTFFQIGVSLIYFPTLYLITDIAFKITKQQKIKHDQTGLLIDNSNRKILVGTFIGLSLLSLLIFAIISPLYPDPNTGSIPPVVEFKNYQPYDVVKYGGIQIFPTTTYATSTLESHQADHLFFIVGLEIRNNYYKHTVTYMIDEFSLIDNNGIEYFPIDVSSGNRIDLSDLKEIEPKANLRKSLVFDLDYDPQMKYDLKIGDIGLYCLRNC